ncbi:putative uncharacterized protein [Corallococcus sp. CAG:1435]|nr:putative uncharacterized protein [Corallococcus sp. CAG:1435]
MSQVKRMLEGKLYCCLVPDEKREQMQKNKEEFLDKFNATSFGDFETRRSLAKQLFAHLGENSFINKPFFCDYGCNISIGDNFYANYDCIMLDVNKITIGDNVFMAPRVCVYTAGHPIDKDVRNAQLEYGYSVTIGNDVWIGGNTVINPGVTIGNNVVIGSNSVVTHDIPDGVVACGNPCRVIRKITDDDAMFWKQQADDFYADLQREKQNKE